LVLTVLLLYRAVTGTRRGGSALLVGLAVGGLLVGVVAVAAPVTVLPAGWASALGAASATVPAPPTQEARAAFPTPSFARPAPPVAPTTSAAPTTTAPRPTPTPTPAAPPAPTTPRRAPASGPTAEVVALTNDARARAGCAALRADPRLATAAQGHSADMSRRGYFAHDSQDGRSFDDRIRAQGYPSPGGENIAMGQQSAQEVVQAWLDSPGHRRNIEDCSFATIGVGLATDGMYWTQDFGR
jgi:uncharacterized protein YkwD